MTIRKEIPPLEEFIERIQQTDNLRHLGISLAVNAEDGLYDHVKALLDYTKVDVNFDGIPGSPLYRAAVKGGHLDIVRLLYARGARDENAFRKALLGRKHPDVAAFSYATGMEPAPWVPRPNIMLLSLESLFEKCLPSSTAEHPSPS